MTTQEKARWIVDNTRHNADTETDYTKVHQGSRVEYAFECLLAAIENALDSEYNRGRIETTEFFKKECSCMAMDKHLEKFKENHNGHQA